MTPDALTVKCYYREDGVHCRSGMLYSSAGVYEPGDAILIEGTGVYCPACEGRGVILTDKGRDLIEFLMKFARPLLRDVVDEVIEERER
jgi:hypothetical protein